MFSEDHKKAGNLGISTNRNKKENEKEDKVALNNKRWTRRVKTKRSKRW